MPWEVKATAWNSRGKEFKTVVEVGDEEVIDDDSARSIMYWIRNMEPGEEVVVRRFTSGSAG